MIITSIRKILNWPKEINFIKISSVKGLLHYIIKKIPINSKQYFRSQFMKNLNLNPVIFRIIRI